MRNCLDSIGFHVKPSAVLRLALYRTLAVALAALAVLSAAVPAPAFAADSDQQVKTVRVGWLINNKGFQEGTPGERLSDWGYGYLQTLSYYTPGWQYEYVSGTFTELMNMLEAGEIDLMPNISYSEEREQKLLFSSNPEGTALLHLRQARSRRPGQGWPPSAPRPYHRLQPRRYANLRRPAVARQRRHHLYL